MIWCEIVVYFLFFSLTSDVPTFQEDEYCRNHLMNGLIDSKKHENRLLTAVVANSLIDWLSKQKDQQLTVILANSRSFSQTSRSFSQTARSFSQTSRSFSQTARSFSQTSRSFSQTARSFSLTHDHSRRLHDAHSENEMHSSPSKREFNWRFYFAYSRIPTSNSLETESLNECQLVSQNSKRKICCARNSESSSLRIDKMISCWKWNRHELIALKTSSSQIDRSRFFLFANRLRMWNLHRSSRWRSNIMSEIVSD